jgi:hypothetical protein
MNFKKWVKSVQTAGYNGAHTVFGVLMQDKTFWSFYPKEDFSVFLSKMGLSGFLS